MVKFEDEVAFKMYLDENGIRYGELKNDCKFYVEFIDNKGDSVISYVIARTPIAALRSLPDLLKKSALPVDDVDVVVRFAFRIEDGCYQYVTVDAIISPYMYFKKENKIGSNLEETSPVETK